MIRRHRLCIIACLTISLVLFCSRARNPFTNPGNASVSIVLQSEPSGGYTVDDTLKIDLPLVLSNLIDSTVISVGPVWDTTLYPDNLLEFDTLFLQKIIDLTGTVFITATIYLENGGAKSSADTVFVKGHPPRIITDSDPTVTVVEGDSLALGVTVAGTGPFAYTWKKGNSLLSSDTTARLVRAAAQLADSGIYQCSVSTAWGSVLSTKTKVSVLPAGSILAPQGLAFTTKNSSGIKIAWRPVAGVDGYRVYRDTTVLSVAPWVAQLSDTSYQDDLRLKTYYWVRAYKGAKMSQPSDWVYTGGDTGINGPPTWDSVSITAAISEGQTYRISLKEICSDPNSDGLVFSILGQVDIAAITGDSLKFIAGHLDSGSYAFTLVADDGRGGLDSLPVTITVRPTVVTLTVECSADSGSVTVTPPKGTYRWGDTVTLQVTPKTGFDFRNWTGSATGSSGSVDIVMDADKSVAAHFVRQPECAQVSEGASLDALIKTAVTAKTIPKAFCPVEGKYETNTIEIKGNVKIIIQ